MQYEYSCYPPTLLLLQPIPTTPPPNTTIKNVLDFCLPRSADTQHVPDIVLQLWLPLSSFLSPSSMRPFVRLSTQSNKFQPCFNIYQSVLKFELLQLRIGTGKQSFSYPLPGETLVRCTKNLPTYTPGRHCVSATRRGAWRSCSIFAFLKLPRTDDNYSGETSAQAFYVCI